MSALTGIMYTEQGDKNAFPFFSIDLYQHRCKGPIGAVEALKSFH